MSLMLPPITLAEIEEELRRIEKARGISTEQFIEFVRSGCVPETPENLEWADLIAARRIAVRMLDNCAPVDPPSGSPVTGGGGTLPGDQT